MRFVGQLNFWECCFDRFTSFEAFYGFPGRRVRVMDGILSVRETESAVFQNETPGNATMPASEGLSHQFIYSVYALIVSGIFVWAALILTSVQVRSSYVNFYPGLDTYSITERCFV